jgi:hypothetical protein
MLELRLTADAKRIASMRAAIGRECRLSNVGAEHAEMVALLAEQLLTGRRSEVLVVVTVQSDATLLMVRDTRPDNAQLGARRQDLLNGCTTRWSTMSGSDGRTIWAEISRPLGLPRSRVPALASAD